MNTNQVHQIDITDAAPIAASRQTLRLVRRREEHSLLLTRKEEESCNRATD